MKVSDVINDLTGSESLWVGNRVAPENMNKLVKKAADAFAKYLKAHPDGLVTVQQAVSTLKNLGKREGTPKATQLLIGELEKKYQVFAEATSLNNLCKVATPPVGSIWSMTQI